MGDVTQIDIGLCTYRRPHVVETLRSLAKLELKADWKIRIIIADNDEKPDAKALIEKTAADNKLDITYIHVPARNISVARNACLNAATAPYLAFIDDDEIASPQWLTALVATMEGDKATGKPDVVLGPVNGTYDAKFPSWMRKGGFHSTRPALVKGRIITGYCGNVLIRRTNSVFESLRFHEELGNTGGEDTIFFAEASWAGVRIEYAPNAVVTEFVPSNRTRVAWLMKRSFRAGQTHGSLLIQRQRGFIARIKNIFVALSKSLFCFVAAAPNLSLQNTMHWILRGSMHAGVVARLLGIRELKSYGS